MIRRWSPPQLIVAGFAILIAFGTLLLRLPQAAQTGRTLGRRTWSSERWRPLR